MSDNGIFNSSLAYDKSMNNNNHRTDITAQTRNFAAIIGGKDNSVEAFLNDNHAPLCSSTFLESSGNKTENKQRMTREKDLEKINDTGYTSNWEGEL